MKKIYFIAGLPRSGSTLLSAILKQNPDFKTGMSSPLEPVYAAALGGMTKRNSFHTFITDSQREDILKAVIEAYYKEVSNSVVVFDTNRNWPMRIGGLVKLFPETKIICCVRDIVSILNSFEHLVQKHPFEISKLFNFDPHMTVYGRTDSLMSSTGSVGTAFNALKEGLAGEYKNKMIIVEYDDLVSQPKKSIERIYLQLGERYYNHDFNNLVHEEEAFDFQIGLPHMHTIRRRVEKEVKPMLLPKDIQQKYRGLECW